MYDHIIKLGTITYEQNAYGQEVETFDWKEVYADVLSVTRVEFYSAAMASIKPTCVFVIADVDDYNEEQVISYDGKLYDVIRTFTSHDSYRLEITAKLRKPDEDREEADDGTDTDTDTNTGSSE